MALGTWIFIGALVVAGLVFWITAYAPSRFPNGLRILQRFRQHKYYNSSGEIIMSTTAGTSSVFQEVPTPTGTAFPTGTTFVWSVDDMADISLTPSTDGTQCTATCVASPAQTSYNLTCVSSYTPAGGTAPLSATLNVAIVAATLPTPTGMQINQLS
jgi:hypothetical protein